MKFLTKLSAIILFAIILPFSISQAQNSDNINPLQRGSKALQFQITDNFSLSSFSGSTFSYKRQLSNAHANRIGLSLSNTYRWKNFPESDTNQKASTLDLNISIEYTWMNYTNPESDIKFFYGYGPGINVGFDRSVDEGTNIKHTTQETLYGIAGIGYAGVEWFIQSSMSLHAEYQTSVRVNHSRNKETRNIEGNVWDSSGNEGTNKSSRTAINFGGDGVKFGLSVYF